VTINIQTILADVRKFAGMIEPAFALVGMVQSVTGVGGLTAATSIKLLDAAFKAFAAHAEGSFTKEQFDAEMTELRRLLATNDAAADAALKAKFPGQ